LTNRERFLNHFLLFKMFTRIHIKPHPAKGFITKVLLAFSLLLGFTAKAQPPVAQFTASNTSGCAPIIITFTDQSTNSPTGWFWDFGNGVTSTLQNPVATYFTPGSYTVILTATNGAGSNTITKTNYIVVHDKPVVGFSASPTSGCTPFNVQFTDASTPGSGTIASWLWDFGDGNTSTLQNPIHSYQTVGLFTVTLRVTNSFGCFSVFSRPQYIDVVNGVNADFTNSAATGCKPPATINFTNTSTGPGTITYQWFFGDGGTSTATNPSYTYTVGGTYTVTLIGTSTTGCADTIIKNNLVVVQNVVSGFTSVDSVCVGALANFVNTTSPLPPTATWNFGDGNSQAGVNATHAYAAPGTYQVKLVNQYATCNDSITRSIRVLAKPTANFNGTNIIGCKPPLTVNFNDLSTGAISWQWSFGNGNTSTLQNPTHTYTNFGQYDITLVVTNASGCTDTLRRPQYVRIVAPTLSVSNLPAESCIPFTLTPNAVINTVDGIATYFWDFGDGVTSTLPNPSHTYNVQGTFTVRLIITTNGGCTDSLIFTNGVRVGTPPTVNFSAAPLVICAFQPVTFTDLSSANVDRWLWNFGDGTTSSVQNPTHSYQDTGLFTVTLTATNNGCARTFVRNNYIRVLPPVARFRDSTDCAARRTKFFINTSIGGVSYVWDFGDGSPTSNAVNPSHTYAAAGNYLVSLTATNGGCTHTLQQTVRVILEAAAFSANPTTQCRTQTVNFTATGSNPANVSSYAWVYGDGNFGTGQTSSHAYDAPGSLTIRLIVTDLNGCADTSIRPNYVRINGPRANFTSANNTGCRNQLVVFNDLTISDGTNALTQWTWDFGDGNVQTFSNPPFTHTYATAGTYSVKLTVRDASGCTDTLTRLNFVSLSNLKAGFISNDTLSCPGSTVRFTDTSRSAGAVNSWVWSFGNGFSSALQNPSTIYTLTGQYAVKLVVTDNLGCRDSIIKPSYIVVDTPRAVFTISDSVGSCPPLEVRFTFQGRYNRSVRWDFGDGNISTLLNPTHVYSVPGNYTARLVVTSPGGCTATTTRLIRVSGPYGAITYTPLSGCKPFDVILRASTNGFTSSILWDFNNGFTFNTPDTIIFYTYPSGGRFVPRVIMSDPSGCLVPVIGIDTITVEDIRADFEAPQRFFCDTGSVQFNNLSTSFGAVSYEWSFGDGNTSTQKNPRHTYTNPGFYNIKLKITSPFGCADSLEKIGYIKVDAIPDVNIYGDTSSCVPANIQLQAIIAVGDTSTVNWLWKFDNGVTSTLQTLDLSYTVPGSYGVTLVGTTLNGCIDSVRRNIRIHPLPVVNAGADTLICAGSSAQLQASGALTYFWLPPSDGTLSCNNCPNPVATPTRDTMYVVRGRTVFGCESDDTLFVKVQQPLTLNVQPPAPIICNGSFVQLEASGAQRYAWTPATGLNSAAIANPRARPTTTTTYTVTGTDTLGCFSQTANVTITVLALPVINAGPDQTITGGGSAVINTTGNFGITGYLWRPAGSLNCDNCPTVIATPKATTTYIIRATNAGGCTATDTVTIFVVCNNQNFFVPNTFSPNNDGVNDVFYPRGKGIERIRSMVIFNRWGERVFEKREFAVNDPSAGWDGRVNGTKANSDVYTYLIEIICENNLVIPYRGNISLVY
jgi:gliding motility-associated-like protein